MLVPDPHPWLGLDYRELLPGLRSGQHRFTLSLTRPREGWTGAGRLRVVCVRPSGEAPESKPHCVLAYERYCSNKPGGARAGPGSA